MNTLDGFRISYTVMTDVTELMRTKNEQEMLMSAMEVSVSRHLMMNILLLSGLMNVTTG